MEKGFLKNQRAFEHMQMNPEQPKSFGEKVQRNPGKRTDAKLSYDPFSLVSVWQCVCYGNCAHTPPSHATGLGCIGGVERAGLKGYLQAHTVPFKAVLKEYIGH